MTASRTTQGVDVSGCAHVRHRYGWISAVAAVCAAIAMSCATPARSADCPGNPSALGTSRILVVDPTEHPRIGTMQYAETLPLRDHEVVLTFDDGPLPPHSLAVLDMLNAECVKATFFIIGRMAKQFPQDVQKIYNAGHTIGTHSENHPLTFNRMPVDKAVREIDDGIAHTAGALGDAGKVAPFFRIPGLLRAAGVEDYLASRNIMTWSADFPADDWRHIPAAQVAHLAISRLEAKGKGVLLLHDIQPRTVAALPVILRELKQRGYSVVHVVPARPDLPKTPTQPSDWRMHPQQEAPVASQWPTPPEFVFNVRQTTPVPALADTGPLISLGQFVAIYAEHRSRVARGKIPLPIAAKWPHSASMPRRIAAIDLPIPDGSVFRIADSASSRLQADSISKSARHIAQPVPDVAATSGATPLGQTPAQTMIPGSHPIPSTMLTP